MGWFADSWEEFVKEGHILFQYMIHNFASMFDGGSKIKHFETDSGIYGLSDWIRELIETYNDDIQRELIPWINMELEQNNLFQETNWMPFRDQESLVHMTLGYRKLFRYKQYILQLSLVSKCAYDDVCEYCKQEENQIHFGVLFYGWKDACSDKLQPCNVFLIPDNNIMPESFWRCDTI